MESIEHVEGLFNYLDRNSEKPVAYMYKAPEGVASRTGTYVKRVMPIFNARPIANELSLDKQGFTLTHQESAVINFYDSTEVRAVYYREMERLVKEITGAVKVHAFDHNVRNRAMAKQGNKGVQEPVRVAHNDYTLKSGPQRVRDLLPVEAEVLLKNRFAIINAWRPIRGPVEESPLAVCDAATMVQQDFVPQDLKYQNRTGEVYSVAYNPNHRWFYFPRMLQTEVMLLKCYDSDPRQPRFTAHSAFEDPTSSPNAAPRESIEVRTLVFFPPENKT